MKSTNNQPAQPAQPAEPARNSSFELACKRYRAMRAAIKDKPFNEQRDAINAFRAGL